MYWTESKKQGKSTVYMENAFEEFVYQGEGHWTESWEDYGTGSEGFKKLEQGFLQEGGEILVLKWKGLYL